MAATPSSTNADAVITQGSLNPAQSATSVLVGTNPTVNFTVTTGSFDAVGSSGPTLACGGVPVPGAPSMGVSGAGVGSSAYNPIAPLPDGATCVFAGTAAAKGVGTGQSRALTWNVTFQTEVQPVVHYARMNLVVFADQSGYIGVINDAAGTVTPLVNKTGYVDGIEPIRLCGLYDKLLDDGRPLASCVTRFVGNTRRNFPINPLTGELMAEYTGDVPAGAVLRDVEYQGDPIPPSHTANNVTAHGMYIDVPAVGTYYFTGNDGVNLRLTKDGFATNKVVATCGGIQCFQYLATFSNP